jgi:small subunit ribosomal protein S7
MLVAKFINSLMYDGKKSKAREVVYQAFDLIEDKTKKPGLEIFKKAINNIQPLIEVRSRRVGGATYQVPTEVRPERRYALAMRWLKTYARARNEKSMSGRLAAELISASNNEGSAVKKKEDTHKMAEANKAFAHFKW